MGYSLTQNYDDVKLDVDMMMDPDDPNAAKLQTLSEGGPQSDGAVPHQSAENNELNETTDILEAKGLQDEEGEQHIGIFNAHQQKVLNKQVAERRQEILKKGSIPEFVPIKDAQDFYRVYQEANYRNKLLIESQHQQQMENMLRGDPIDANKTMSADNPDLKNIKDDVVIMQFKLVRKDTLKILNTQTFVNIPISKMNDINVSTLMEII